MGKMTSVESYNLGDALDRSIWIACQRPSETCHDMEGGALSPPNFRTALTAQRPPPARSVFAFLGSPQLD